MKKKQLLYSKGLFLAIAGIAISGSAFGQTITNTYTFTGGNQTFTIPCGVDTVNIQAWGAEGGDGAVGGNNVAGGQGNWGGFAMGDLLVSPGEVLNIFVGSQGATPAGGFNGGGAGGTQNAGGGGGASDVRLNGTAESDRVITAGGGGGGGRGGCDEASGTGGVGGIGGEGGGGNGGNGADSPTSGGVAGGGFGGNAMGVPGAGGAAGIGCGGFLGLVGSSASTGTGGTGGGGQSCCCSSQNSVVGGGGGGGGQIGGGGGGGGSAGTTGCSGNSKGAGGGGGGGTSYTGGVANGTMVSGVRTGNGEVVISYEDPTPAAAVITNPTTSACVGQDMTFTCAALSEATSYTWTISAGASIVSGQGTNAITVTPNSNFTVEVFGSNGTCGLDGPSSATLSVTVNPIPTVDITSTMTGTFCGGQDVLLTGNPAGGTFSQLAGPVNGLTSNVFNATQIGNYTVGYTFTDANGCTNTASLDFVIDCMLDLTLISGQGSLNVFPNPNNGSFTITSDLTDRGQLELFNLSGQLVHSSEIDNLSNANIDIKNLEPGVYKINITSGDNKFMGSLNIIK